jgi:hypothetical protein
MRSAKVEALKGASERGLTISPERGFISKNEAARQQLQPARFKRSNRGGGNGGFAPITVVWHILTEQRW